MHKRLLTRLDDSLGICSLLSKSVDSVILYIPRKKTKTRGRFADFLKGKILIAPLLFSFSLSLSHKRRRNWLSILTMYIYTFSDEENCREREKIRWREREKTHWKVVTPGSIFSSLRSFRAWTIPKTFARLLYFPPTKKSSIRIN